VAAAGVSLFRHRVGDFVRRPPLTCTPQTTAAEVARRLSAAGVGAAVVVDAAGAAVGIVTDRDLRRKVVAEARDAAATPAGAIMSAPLVAVPPTAFAFDALLAMTQREIHHLGVVADGRLVGVVSTHDFLVLQTTHPVTLVREIARAPSVDALATVAGRVTALVDRLVREGGTAGEVATIVAELNDRIVRRVLALTAAALADAGDAAPPDVPFCWLLLGSEARREQTLRTDQDNGLVYADPPPELADAAARHYARFARRAVDALIAVGFPRCPGDAMASNPQWCQPQSVWARYFRRWMREASPAQVLAASIYFDLRPLGGAVALGAALADLVRTEAPGERRFLGLLARDVVDRRLPLTLFGHVAVARNGPHRGAVDVKGAGVVQLVGAARLHALHLGAAETGTLARFRAAGAAGLYRDAEVREIGDAFQHLLRLRLVNQLAQLAAGEPPDNSVVPNALSRADALLFRDALRTVGRVQAGVRERFATEFLP
jgi:CBS domain-containing protein